MNQPSFAPIRFGHCEVTPARRLLRVHGQPVELHGRAFDLLVALLQAEGQVVSKDELMRAVWPGRIVEENTLEAQVSLLRKALGPERKSIRTVSGRGYQFTGQAPTPPPSANLHIPLGVSRLIGREEALAELADSIRQQRLVTLIGPGGIGKTRLALECARDLSTLFPERVCLADLATLSTAEFLIPSIASALGLAPASDKADLEQIAGSLADRRILLLLDNCEHLIEPAAAAVETLLRANSSLQILATSREPLRIEGEHLYRVAPLVVPAADAELAEVLASSSVRLFEARQEHGQLDFMTQQQTAELKARICRRLDGIPLAIELAAARVATLGLAAVAERLEHELDLLAGGNRSALPRQQTLRATLDWSFALLYPRDQALLRRLSVFAGSFGLDGALAVGVSADLAAESIAEGIASLVSKSLLTLTQQLSGSQYRLLETTRNYASEKLASSGEQALSQRLHALYLLEVFSSASSFWELGQSPRCALCETLQEDLREALRWTLDQGHDAVLGIDLSIAALPFWLQRSQVAECLLSASRALAHLAKPELFERKVMKLEVARGKALLYTGATFETREAFQHALSIASRLDEYDHQALAIWGIWAHGYLNGPYTQNLQIAEDFLALAQRRPEAGDELVAQRMIALSQLCLGRLDEARDGLQHVMQQYPERLRQRHILRYAYDQKVAALCALAYTLWLQGYPDQARQTFKEAEHQAQACGHLASRWHVLTMSTCAINLLLGGLPALAQPSQQLLDARGWQHLGAHPIGAGQFWGGEFWRGLYRLWQGEAEAYDRVICPALDQLGRVRFASYLAPYTSALCLTLAQHDRLNEALRLIDMAIAHATGADDISALPELIRCQGELLLAASPNGWSGPAEELLLKAQTMARQHGLKSWELRATTSLARLWLRQGKHTRASRELGELMASFCEGFGSADFESARQLMKALGS
ncbi:ATP-binding protein [Aquipseudomonas alcaligenes]|uniref:ATP-binding protein n=1 Tax=Aquipseudomonas alcaligenes TaxID=43263 RepID=UPI003749A57C